MLHHGKKLLFLWVFVMSCQDKGSKQNHSELTMTFKAISFQQTTISVYNQVRRQAKDSLQNWVTVGLNSSMNLKVNTWELDSLMCFNKKGDKFISSVGIQLTKYSDTDHDGMYYFYGVKINEEWYFFFGPYLVLQRLAYQKEIHTPLPFTKLHEIAMQEVFRGYLKKKDLGFWRNVFGKAEYEVNEEWFKSHFEGPGWDRNCRTAECYEKLYLAKVQNNWKHRDTTNYKP